jgi:hypothetical protein
MVIWTLEFREFGMVVIHPSNYGRRETGKECKGYQEMEMDA